MFKFPYLKIALVSSLLGHVGAGYLIFKLVSLGSPVEVGQPVFEVNLVSTSDIFVPEVAPIGTELSTGRARLRLSKVTKQLVPLAIQSGQTDGVIDADNRLKGDGLTSDLGSVQAVKPEYPEESRLNGEEGQVKFRVRVDTQGRPTLVELGSSSGYSRLDRAARKAVLASGFTPSRVGAQPVESEINLTYSFKLVVK